MLTLISVKPSEDIKVMIDTWLAVNLECRPQSSMPRIGYTVEDASNATMNKCHGTPANRIRVKFASDKHYMIRFDSSSLLQLHVTRLPSQLLPRHEPGDSSTEPDVCICAKHNGWLGPDTLAKRTSTQQ